jgi:hypothetical protein
VTPETPSREAAIVALDAGRAAVDALTARLSDDEIERRATLGGGDWSVKDLLGHLASWEEYAVEAIEAHRACRMAWIEATPLDVDALNAEAVEAKAGRSLEEIRREAGATHAQLIELIEAMPDAEWATPTMSQDPSGNPRTLGALLGAITGSDVGSFRHVHVHLADLEAMVDAAGEPAGSP